MIAQSGDTLELITPGPYQYSVDLNFFANKPERLQLAAGKPILVEVPKAEPAPTMLMCNNFPWMRAYAIVLDHPFAAVSDSNGNLEINDLPVGTSLTFQVFHEAAVRIDRVKVANTVTDWRRSRFTIDLVTGVNDLAIF